MHVNDMRFLRTSSSLNSRVKDNESKDHACQALSVGFSPKMKRKPLLGRRARCNESRRSSGRTNRTARLQIPRESVRSNYKIASDSKRAVSMGRSKKIDGSFERGFAGFTDRPRQTVSELRSKRNVGRRYETPNEKRPIRGVSIVACQHVLLHGAGQKGGKKW